MANMTSSLVAYCEKNPQYKPPSTEVAHEMAHLVKRERLSGFAALGCGALAGIVLVITLVGVLGAGYMLFGALAAIAVIAGVYSYFCRQAECMLTEKHFKLIE